MFSNYYIRTIFNMYAFQHFNVLSVTCLLIYLPVHPVPTTATFWGVATFFHEWWSQRSKSQVELQLSCISQVNWENEGKTGAQSSVVFFPPSFHHPHFHPSVTGQLSSSSTRGAAGAAEVAELHWERGSVALTQPDPAVFKNDLPLMILLD